MILITHGHYDHLGAVAEIKSTYNCPILIHWAEKETLTNPTVNLSAFAGENVICPEADQILDDGDKIKLGKLTLEVIHVPGHSEGSICFRCDDFVIGGDLLFRGGVGRTDLPGGSFEELAYSIKNKIYTLPDETIVYSGHGESTTVGYEKKYNPFVRT
jgi:glyoxylase-like metal-dependent hydrolase (beta-lactamase superfamily II)